MIFKKISQEERNERVLKHLPLVKYCAIRFLNRLPNIITYDELFSAGVMGLIDAAEKFDPSLEIPFEKYAFIRIKGAMLDEIRAKDPIPRNLRDKLNRLEKALENFEAQEGRMPTEKELAEKLGIENDKCSQLLDYLKGLSVMPLSLEELLEQGIHPESHTTNGEEPIKTIYQKEIAHILSELISELPEKEQILLSLYYKEELTMKEIGEILGYTESRVSQLHTQIILKLRNRLRRRFSKHDI